MRHFTLLVFSAALVAMAASCTKENASENLSFAGIEVEVGEHNGSGKLLILNEGAFPGMSTLDLLDFKTNQYYADVFGQANPEVAQGLGNTGNDMALVNGRLWVLMNASNQVSVLDFPSCKLYKTLEMESPRHIVVSGSYAYISSYGAAIYGADPTPGKVYRVNTADFSTSNVEVGDQPEGLSVVGNKLFVANSGGYDYIPDNRLTEIDLGTFTVTAQHEMPARNLNLMEHSGGKLWISTYGESTWAQDESGNWLQNMSVPKSLVSVDPSNAKATVINGVHADKMTLCGDYLYIIGNDAEMAGGWDLCLYKVDTRSASVTKTAFSSSDLGRIIYPYGLLANPDNGDLYICDASFTGTSKVYCFDSALRTKWMVDTGVGTGHLLLTR